MMGDFKCDICNNSAHAEIILESLPAGFRIVPKDSRHTYIRISRTLNNIDHFVCYTTVSSSDVNVDEVKRDYDRLAISLSVSIYVSQSRLPVNGSKLDKNWCYKSEWRKIYPPLYMSTLAALLLSTIKNQFNLLCTSISLTNGRSLLSKYYLQILACLKQAEFATPRFRVRLTTLSSIWKDVPELKGIKNRTKFWFHIWIACDCPKVGRISYIEFVQFLQSISICLYSLFP